MKLIIKTILLATVIAAMLPTVLEADINIEPEYPPKMEYKLLANEISAQYAVKASTVKKIIGCESSWNADAHNKTKYENSYGLVQINLKSHTDVTVDEATDPQFAIDYLAKNLSEGNGHMWSCYK